MNKINQTRRFKASLLFAITSLLFFTSGCKKNNDTPAADQLTISVEDSKSDSRLKDFLQTNLVANNNLYGALHVDPNLINAWGIAWSPTGVAWIGAQAAHVSDVYNSEGNLVLGPVKIPSPGGPIGGNPTGLVFNPNATDFIIPSGNTAVATGARFIFVGVDGIVSGWNPTWGTNAFAKFNNVATSAYTGLTLASNAGSNFLYAADFRAGKIAVWDKNWNAVSMPFQDTHIPTGYSPFNIQVVNGQLFVTYAKVGQDGRSQAGNGKGFVNIYSTSGQLIKRFAAKDNLNAPWGVAMAPATFFPQKMDGDDDNEDHHGKSHHDNNNNDVPQPAILIGNFGDGHINVYSLAGKSLGQLRKHRHVLTIDGLWAIMFPPTTSTIDPNRLYFAAGPKLETEGLFGYIIKDSTAHQEDGGHQEHH